MLKLKKKLKSSSSGGTESSGKDFSALMKRIKPVSELPKFISLLVYGRSGTGKTTMACTFPGPILLLDVRDQGTDSVQDVKGVEILPVEHWDDFEMTYWYLRENGHKYKTIVVDTLTQLQDLAISKVLEVDGSDKMSQRLWGDVSGMLKQWVMSFRDLPMHTVFIAQDRETRSEEGADSDDQLTPEIGPWMVPSAVKVICASMKVIGNTYIRGKTKINAKTKKKIFRTEYRMRVGPHPVYVTKIRKPRKAVAPDFLVNPEFKTIVEIMEGKYQPKAVTKE